MFTRKFNPDDAVSPSKSEHGTTQKLKEISECIEIEEQLYQALLMAARIGGRQKASFVQRPRIFDDHVVQDVARSRVAAPMRPFPTMLGTGNPVTGALREGNSKVGDGKGMFKEGAADMFVLVCPGDTVAVAEFPSLRQKIWAAIRQRISYRGGAAAWPAIVRLALRAVEIPISHVLRLAKTRWILGRNSSAPSGFRALFRRLNASKM